MEQKQEENNVLIRRRATDEPQASHPRAPPGRLLPLHATLFTELMCVTSLNKLRCEGLH
jgi:hypothetical protein